MFSILHVRYVLYKFIFILDFNSKLISVMLLIKLQKSSVKDVAKNTWRNFVWSVFPQFFLWDYVSSANL